MDDRLRAYQRRLKAGDGTMEEYLRLVEQSGQGTPPSAFGDHADTVRKYILNGGTLVRTPMGATFERPREPIIHAITWLISQNFAHRALIICPRSMMPSWIRLLRAMDLNFTGVLGVGQVDRLLGAGSFSPITLISYDALVRVVPQVLNQLGPTSESWWPIIVCDEVAMIRRDTLSRHKAVVNLARMGGAKTRIAISSMPLTNYLPDIYSVFRFVEPSVFPTTVTGFVEEFMRFTRTMLGPDGGERLCGLSPQETGLSRVLDRVKNNCLDIRNID